MNFILGTIMVVAAVVLVGFAKYVITRWESSSWVQRFAGTETMALTITALMAFGIASLFAGLASSHSGVGLTQSAASLGCIALAVIGVVRVFRRLPARALTAPTRAPI